MIKNILLGFLLIFFSSCKHAPEPEAIPDWYTSPPVDYDYFYVVGIGNDKEDAQNNALTNFRISLAETLDVAIRRQNHPLGYLDENVLNVLSKSNEEIANTILISDVKIEESVSFNFKTLLLLKISRQDIFKNADLASASKIATSKERYEKLSKLPDLEKYTQLKILISNFAGLSTYTQLKEICVPKFDASKDFEILKDIYESLLELRSSFTFYILSDANSIGFVNFIKEGISKESLALHSKLRDENSYKILITSKSESSIDYSFMQSKTVLKAELYDSKGLLLAKKQHTFIGKSRDSHKDAKEQAAQNLRAKISKLGFFDFIGLKTTQR